VKLELHVEAEAEIEEACDFYDERRPGLGQELLVEVRRGFDLIREAPRRWPHWPDTPPLEPPVRRVVLNHFPFAIGYQVLPDRVVLLTVAHTSREPMYWLERAGESPNRE